MTRWTIALLALAVAAGACSSGGQSQRDDEMTRAPAEATTPKMGLVTSVDSQRLMMESTDDPGGEEALFERTTRSVVMRDGNEVGWEEISEGDAVRVTWDRGIFGPDRVAHVEVLGDSEADQVRQQLEGDMQMDDDGFGQPLEPRPIDPGVGMPGEPMPPAGQPDSNF